MTRGKAAAVLVLGVAGLGAAGRIAAAEPEQRTVEVLRLGREGVAWLGVTLGDLSADQARGLKLEAAQGARVERVEPGSPAEQAGLQTGDVVLRFDGERVRSAAQLARLVRETPVRRRLGLEVWREGSAHTLSAELAERGARGAGAEALELRLPEADDLADLAEPGELPRWRGLPHALRGPQVLGGGPRRLGIAFQEIEGQLARYFELEGERGLLVTEVDEGSPAAKGGVRAGDVLLAFDQTRLRDAGDLRAAVGRAQGGQPLLLDLLRGGKKLQVNVTLPARRGAGAGGRPI